MSILKVNSISSKTGNGNIVVVTGNRLIGSDIGSLYAPGMIIQTIYVRTDERNVYSSNPSGNGIEVTPLNLTITPKLQNSMILCQWMVNGELHQDNVFLIWKNGQLSTNGYNTQAGNSRWSGYASAFYDQNESSTPSNWKIMYADTPNSTSPITYSLACRSTTTGTYAFYLNRTVSSIGADSYENMVSVGLIQEIAQ
jgi:hypothetical protein